MKRGGGGLGGPCLQAVVADWPAGLSRRDAGHEGGGLVRNTWGTLDTAQEAGFAAGAVPPPPPPFPPLGSLPPAPTHLSPPPLSFTPRPHARTRARTPPGHHPSLRLHLRLHTPLCPLHPHQLPLGHGLWLLLPDGHHNPLFPDGVRHGGQPGGAAGAVRCGTGRGGSTVATGRSITCRCMRMAFAIACCCT